MDFLAYIFLSKLPLVLERSEIIDGKEEKCLLIPTKINQLKKGKQGNWYFICRLAECEPNAKSQTHEIQLTYVSPEDLQKSYDFGYHRRTAHMGHVYEHDRTPEKKIDRTNNASDIDLRGNICLSDIPRDLIFANAENAKKYISNLTFKAIPNNGIIFTGSICLSDIPKEDVTQDPNTGKKYVAVRLLKLKLLDTYMNTHQLIIARNGASEIEIGRFKEFHSVSGVTQSTPAPPEEIHNTGVNQRQTPSEIDGIRF